MSIEKVLLVEDLAAVRDWLARVARDTWPGVEVVTVASLADAVAALDEQAFSLALVDLGLPDGSGLSLIRQLNRDHPDTYCVVTTIFDDDEHLFGALRAGAHGYLLKDQAGGELAERLKGILAGQPPLSATIARRVLATFSEGTEPPAPEHDLTPREHEVLTLIAKGCSIGEAAELLGISRHTAAGYVKDVYRKLNVSSRAEATLEAARLGIVKVEA